MEEATIFQCPSVDDCFATWGLLTISISWEAVEKNSNNSLKTAAGYGMEISSDKGKIMVNSIKTIPFSNIWVNGKVLKEVDQFKHLGSTHNKDGTSQRKYRSDWRKDLSHDKAGNVMDEQSHHPPPPTKIKLCMSLVSSILLYGCDSWTLTADLEKRIQAFENKRYRGMVDMSYREHKTN